MWWHAIDCLGSMIMGLEVKWSTVVVSRTDPIKEGQILTPPIFKSVFNWRYRSNQMSEHKTKDTIAILMTSRTGCSLWNFNSTFSLIFVITRIQKWLLNLIVLIPNIFLNLYTLYRLLEIWAFKQGPFEVIMWYISIERYVI